MSEGFSDCWRSVWIKGKKVHGAPIAERPGLGVPGMGNNLEVKVLYEP